MILRILQLDIKNPKSHGIIYMNYDRIKDQFDLSKYSIIYEDKNFSHINPLTNEPFEESTTKLLDYIFRIFNIGKKPETYKGHSLSVSDIIELDGVMYYVDGFGFKKL